MLTTARTIIIKTGSSLVTDATTGDLRAAWMDAMAEDIAQLAARGARVVLVASGAVALGRKQLGYPISKKLKLEEKQAAAACGQVALMQAWQQRLQKHGKHVAQILLTLDDSENRRRYLNATNTLSTLLQAGTIPIINENDSVATYELRVGDNDRLAARVAQMVGAEVLVLLSDIDGLYTGNPREDKNAQHIARVEQIDAAIEQMAGGAAAEGVGSGGMRTKIMAAKMAAAAGCSTIITLGVGEHPLRALQEGVRHTLFVAQHSPESARKQWIGHGMQSSGKVVIDAGAVAALRKGNSLLPAGIRGVEGHFQRGDAVDIVDDTGKIIGRGLAAFNAEHTAQIMGKSTDAIAELLNYTGRTEFIHRDNLVLRD